MSYCFVATVLGLPRPTVSGFAGDATSLSDVGLPTERCHAVVYSDALLKSLIPPQNCCSLSLLCELCASTLSTVTQGFTYSPVSIDLRVTWAKFGLEGFGSPLFCFSKPLSLVA
jgi:hypothetical protein